MKEEKMGNDGAKTVFIISCMVVLIAAIASVYFWYDFSKNCEDYLKLTGDAPNIEKADKFLGKAIEHIERKGLTNGNSAYIFDKPDNDLQIWYEQIHGAKDTTANILEREANNPGSVTQLEKDNALMKIREVVLDDSSSGTSVTVPDNITWYPYQWLILLWWIISIIVALISGLIAFD